MSKVGVPLEGFAQAAGEAAKEGIVLLKNEGKILPIKASERISVFGRCQIDFYRSGTGSGGAVNVAYTTNLLGSLREKSTVVNEKLAGIYEAWIAQNPFDNGGGGWAAEPWNQTEMPLCKEMVEEAKAESDKAVVVIGRTAGEDKDNADMPGSLRLTEEEERMLQLVTTYFDQVVVILNVSNIIDMSFMSDEVLGSRIGALLYTWQGGMEGGRAAADILLGNAVPSGKLPDTIAFEVKDYPSTPFYGDQESNCYVEDIYVGYRYFETFCPEKVMYEFGYGISYTDFEIITREAAVSDGKITLVIEVQNAGTAYAGKEVVQVYYEAPQGKLGQPARQLLAYGKTGVLAPGTSQNLEFSIDLTKMKTYDDSGLTGEKSAYVMEAGEYHIYVGNSIRKTEKVLTYVQEALEVVEKLQEAMAPTKAFQRMRPGQRKPEGTYELQYEEVPTQTISLRDRIQANLPAELPQTGNQGILLKDVREGKASLDAFISQLNKAELAILVRGEGMGHPDVTEGTASAFGSVGESLMGYGIPLACTADGPSGIRMGGDLKSTQLPIGTLLASSFNDELIEQLYVMEGQELLRNEVDLLLGPGMNIHRNPMNGRNFEYYSEDPLLTGNMASAVIRGIAAGGACATAKHFACNNQETARSLADSVVSERAAREIYLKGFEIAVKEGKAKAIMTSYNPINGHWAASNYDLNTTILRNEWGFDGIVMTDWWAKMNNVEEGGPASGQNMRDMVRSGNDVYMIVNNYGAEANSGEDDLLQSLREGTLTIGELQQSARNLCGFLMTTDSMNRPRRVATQNLELMPLREQETALLEDISETAVVIGEIRDGEVEAATVPVKMSETIYIQVKKEGSYNVLVHMMSVDFNTAQTTCELYVNDARTANITARGTEGKWITQKLIKIKLHPGIYSLRVEEVKPNLLVDGIRFEYMD